MFHVKHRPKDTIMTTLTYLMNRDDIKAVWFWTRSASTGPYEEYEVFDVVFTKNGQPSATGPAERPTLYVRGIGGSVGESMRNNGGKRIVPDDAETLAAFLKQAIDIDNADGFESWADEVWDTSPIPMNARGIPESDTTAVARHAFAEANRARETYELNLSRFADLRRWLGDSYNEYVQADLDA